MILFVLAYFLLLDCNYSLSLYVYIFTLDEVLKGQSLSRYKFSHLESFSLSFSLHLLTRLEFSFATDEGREGEGSPRAKKESQ